MSTEFGQAMMRILDQGSIDFRNKSQQVIDNFIRKFPNMIRGSQITQYTVESILRQFRSEVLHAEQDLLHRFVILASRQIYDLYQKEVSRVQSENVNIKKQASDLQSKFNSANAELSDTSNRVQSLVNLIEEADVSIQQLMEERDSLHGSISETIKKVTSLEKSLAEANEKNKKYEAQLSAMQNEASSALDNLAEKLADQEKKWQKRFERAEQKWQLRLLEASMKSSEGETKTESKDSLKTPKVDGDFKEFKPKTESEPKKSVAQPLPRPERTKAPMSEQQKSVEKKTDDENET